MSSYHFLVNKKRWSWRGVISLIIVGAFFGFASCDEDGPNDVGLGGIETGELAGNLKTDTIYVEDLARDTSFMDSVTTGKADRWYLGSVDNYDFRIAMQFTMPTEVESVTVTSAKLKLITSGAYGVSGSFTAKVYAMKKTWTLDDLKWNRLSGAGDYGDPIAQTTINYSTTAGNIVTFDIPKDTVQHWVWSLKDTARAKLNNGLLIDFSGATFAQQFYGAYNLTSLGIPDTNVVPRLDISYQKFDPKNSELTVDHINLTPVNTPNGYYTQGLSGYIYRDNAPQSVSTLTVGGGVPYHSLFYFNTSKIPATATINLAKLVMKLDPSPGANYRFTAGDSLLLQALRVTDLNWQAGSTSTLGFDQSYINTLSRFRKRLTDNVSDDSLTFNITRQLQDWITFPSQNYGLKISHADEVFGNFRQLYRVGVIHDPMDRENSPKIIIFYTLPPEN